MNCSSCFRSFFERYCHKFHWQTSPTSGKQYFPNIKRMYTALNRIYVLYKSCIPPPQIVRAILLSVIKFMQQTDACFVHSSLTLGIYAAMPASWCRFTIGNHVFCVLLLAYRPKPEFLTSKKCFGRRQSFDMIKC